MDKKIIRGAIAEFIGMTLFVYVGTGAAISTGEQLASSAAPTSTSVARILPIAFAFGISILVQAYSFGHISGGHFNPAVSYCLYLVGECGLLQFFAYLFAQCAGATLGSLLLWASVSAMSEDRKETTTQVIGNPPFGLGANGLNPALLQANGFLLEVMGTLVLCMTVLQVALPKKGLAQGTPNLAPLAIGFAVFLSHLVLIPLTGCGINPARTLGPAVVNSMAGSNVWENSSWIYFFGPFTASVVASFIFKAMKSLEEEDDGGNAESARKENDSDSQEV